MAQFNPRSPNALFEIALRNLMDGLFQEGDSLAAGADFVRPSTSLR